MLTCRHCGMPADSSRREWGNEIVQFIYSHKRIDAPPKWLAATYNAARKTERLDNFEPLLNEGEDMKVTNHPQTCPVCSADATEDALWIHNGLGGEKRRGFVHISWGGLRAQFSPQQAREHALALIECAEAAESDEAVFKLLRKRIQMDEQRALQFVAELRHFRETNAKERKDDD